LKKFREEQQKLNESEALQKAREKFVSKFSHSCCCVVLIYMTFMQRAIEAETSKSSEVFRENIEKKFKEVRTEEEWCCLSFSISRHLMK
jgi:hypothetical protein